MVHPAADADRLFAKRIQLLRRRYGCTLGLLQHISFIFDFFFCIFIFMLSRRHSFAGELVAGAGTRVCRAIRLHVSLVYEDAHLFKSALTELTQKRILCFFGHAQLRIP